MLIWPYHREWQLKSYWSAVQRLSRADSHSGTPSSLRISAPIVEVVDNWKHNAKRSPSRDPPKLVTPGRFRVIVLSTRMLKEECILVSNDSTVERHLPLRQPSVNLSEVRDRSAFSSRNTSKGALVAETHEMFSAIHQGLPASEARKAILDGSLVRKTSFETRRKIVDSITYRYFWPHSEWSRRCLATAAADGARSSGFLSLAYLYCALRDRLTFEFVVGPVWTRWKKHSTSVSSVEVLQFMEEQAGVEEQIKKWRESTRAKLASNVLSSLRDFGMLSGIYSKQIRKPVISPETVFHLLCVLLAEGQDGRSAVEAQDWRLFLWSETEVAQALGELAQRRWIRFEKSGRTVMLELLRQPGEEL